MTQQKNEIDRFLSSVLTKTVIDATLYCSGKIFFLMNSKTFVKDMNSYSEPFMCILSSKITLFPISAEVKFCPIFLLENEKNLRIQLRFSLSLSFTSFHRQLKGKFVKIRVTRRFQ